MRCPNCGFENAKGSVFCPQCGILIADTNAVKKVSLHCCSCGGTLTIDDDKTVLACPSCGNKKLRQHLITGKI